MSEKGRRLFELALGPIALALMGNSDKESIALIKKLESKYGNNWVEKWLQYKGLDLNPYGVAA